MSAPGFQRHPFLYIRRRCISNRPPSTWRCGSILTAGLVGAWILDLAPASATLRDLSGNGNHGTLFGSSIARVNYRGGRALFFNGDNNADRYDLGSIDSANPLRLSGDVLTFVAGFRLQQSGLGNTFPRVFDNSDGAGLTNGCGFYIDDGVGDDYRFDVNGATYGSDTLTGNDKYRYHIACVTKDGGTLTFFKDSGDQANFGQVGGTNAIPSATTNAAIGNWNHTTDRNWHGYIDFVYLWNRVLDLGARRDPQQPLAVRQARPVGPHLRGVRHHRPHTSPRRQRQGLHRDRHYLLIAGPLPLNLNSDALGIGRHVTSIADPFNGHIDEFRIAHVQRSDGWIETTWNNMSDPGGFAAAGAEEQEGGEPPPLAGAGVVVYLMG